jgi:all-trans-8'-apo-beta-carotenal 15,15'-oxygenase
MAARRSARWELLSQTIGEFPTIAPRASASRHRFVYLAAHGSLPAGRAGLHDRIVKVDVETGREDALTLGAGSSVGEPLFAPRPGGDGEDDGWLLVQVYDARVHASHVAVIDAQRLSEGPVAAAWFDHHLPPNFHGIWAPSGP